MPEGFEAAIGANVSRLPARQVGHRVIDAARVGDVAAFESIVRHYDARLRGLAWRLVQDPVAMDDAMQEAYVKAFRAMPSFTGRSSLGTWLYRITYNACIDHVRRSGVTPTAEVDPGELVARRDTEGEVVRRLSLEGALASLPLDQQAAVLLVDGEGLGYDEAARILGCRPGTLASRLSRARETLRTLLTDEDRTEVAR